MTFPISNLPSRRLARIAGILYLLIIISGIFAEFFVRSGLIVVGNAAETASKIMASESIFRIGIAGDFIMIICDVALALVFYILFKPVDKILSLLAAFFRLIQAAILGMNLLNLFSVLQILSGAAYLTVFPADQLQAEMMFFLNAHQSGYAIGLVFFGIQCFVLGYLIIKSDFIPGILGILLIIAGFAYLFDSFASFLFMNYAYHKELFTMVVFLPAFIAELALCLWLLIKGVRVQAKDNHIH